MKRYFKFIGFIAILLVVHNFKGFAQVTTECKVLLESISGKYEGDCKNGLAHGRGTAEGKDKYTGRFREGLPDGGGIYYFSNGDYFHGAFKAGKKSGKGEYFSALNNKKIKGIWKEDSLNREITDPPYEILQNHGVNSISVTSKAGGNPNTVELAFSRDGQISYNMPSLSLSSTTGNVVRNSYYSAVEYISYPVDISLTFSAASRFNTVMVRYEAKVRINKPGSWKIVLRY